MKIDEDDKKTKVDDDFFKIPLQQWNVQEKNFQQNRISRAKELLPYLSPVSLVLTILIAIATGYLWMQISSLGTGIENLNVKVSGMDTTSLKSRLMTAEAALEHVNKENNNLKSELAHLRNEMEAMKARKEKAEAAALKQVPAKKKAIGGSARTR